jgi:hypothetical protein
MPIYYFLYLKIPNSKETWGTLDNMKLIFWLKMQSNAVLS